MKRILLIADVRGWAYDDACQNWKALLSSEYNIDILYLEDYPTLKISHKFVRVMREMNTNLMNGDSLKPDSINKQLCFENQEGVAPTAIFNHENYDGILFFYHRAICDYRLMNTPFPLSKVAISINNEKWVGQEMDTFESYFEGSKVLTGCNSFVLDSYKNIHPNVMRISQAINPSVFNIKRKNIVSQNIGSNFVVGWAGNYSNKIKNYNIVKAACDKAKVKLLVVRDLSRKELNLWYNKIDAVVCASDSEGGPLMLLEAGACAVPVITAPVGLAREIIKNNQNGMLVTNGLPGFVAAINKLKEDPRFRIAIAKRLHKEVLANWTYESRLEEVRMVLEKLYER